MKGRGGKLKRNCDMEGGSMYICNRCYLEGGGRLGEKQYGT